MLAVTIGCAYVILRAKDQPIPHADKKERMPAVTVGTRHADYGIDPLFLKRQSKNDLHRTLTSAQMKEKLMSCLEAARWAPSGGNGQPWRFIYAVHGTKQWDRLLNLLNEGNQVWAKHAGALVVVLSNTVKEHNGKPLKSHSFEAGMAVGNFLMQATQLGLITHPMGGYNAERAYKELNIPRNFDIEIILAVGELAPKKHSNKEFAGWDSEASQRKKVSEIAFDGEMPHVVAHTPS